jgi:hypothetical protein
MYKFEEKNKKFTFLSLFLKIFVFCIILAIGAEK